VNPKTVEVLGLALKVLDQAMKQQAASSGHGWPQQQSPMQPPPDFDFGACSGAFWNPGIPPVFNPVFDPSGFYPAAGFGWNGSPWPFC
jgi:hypothetical protein